MSPSVDDQACLMSEYRSTDVAAVVDQVHGSELGSPARQQEDSEKSSSVLNM